MSELLYDGILYFLVAIFSAFVGGYILTYRMIKDPPGSMCNVCEKRGHWIPESRVPEHYVPYDASTDAQTADKGEGER